MSLSLKGISHLAGAVILHAALALCMHGALPAASWAEEPALLKEQTPASATEPIKVIYEAKKLSLEAANVSFGIALEAVAKAGGFETEISLDVRERPLSTSMKAVTLEKAVQRLLALVGHKNYFIYYRPDGSIRKVEVYGSTVRKAGQQGVTVQDNRQQQQRPSAFRRPGAIPQRNTAQPARIPARPRPTTPGQPSYIPPSPVIQRGPEQTPPPVGMDNIQLDPSETLPPDQVGPDGVPYIAPAQEPVYVPPTRR